MTNSDLELFRSLIKLVRSVADTGRIPILRKYRDDALALVVYGDARIHEVEFGEGGDVMLETFQRNATGLDVTFIADRLPDEVDDKSPEFYSMAYERLLSIASVAYPIAAALEFAEFFSEAALSNEILVQNAQLFVVVSTPTERWCIQLAELNGPYVDVYTTMGAVEFEGEPEGLQNLILSV